MGKRCRFFCKAALSRFLFALHGAIVCAYFYMVRGGDFSKYLGSPLLLLPIEMVVTLRCTKHGEWKWFSPALMLYLFCVIPGIGFLHVDIHERRIEKMDDPDVPECERLVKNTSSFPELHYESGRIFIPNMQNYIKLTEWPEVLEQTTMFLVILGRWMLPKGNLTREQLSQLLLVYLGMAADILEFSSESMAQPVVACDLIKIGIVTAIWGMSLCQFTLVLTSVAGPKIRNFRGKNGKRNPDRVDAKIDNHVACFVEQDIEVPKRPSICGSEIWSLLIVLFLQDCPFLAMRLYLIISIKVVDRAMLFFAGKNLLVFMLVTYRIIVLYGEHKGQTKVRPVPLVGVPQQSEVDAIVVREKRSNWPLVPLLHRVTVLTSRLRNHVREIASRLGEYIPSKSDVPTITSMTPSPAVMECRSLEVTEVDDVDNSAGPINTETELTDISRSMSPYSDDRPATSCKTENDRVDDASATILNLHLDNQVVSSVVEVGNDDEEMTSLNGDITKENLKTGRNNLTFQLDHDALMKPAEVNDGSSDGSTDDDDINSKKYMDT